MSLHHENSFALRRCPAVQKIVIEILIEIGTPTVQKIMTEN